MNTKNIKVYRIEEDLYILEALEHEDHIYFNLMKNRENGKAIWTIWGKNVRNIFRTIMTDYEVPSIADRAYRMEGHYFVIRITDNDIIVDFIYDWEKTVRSKRFPCEEDALRWILNHFEV